MDRSICESGFRKEEWKIEAHSKKQLLTHLGNVVFHKTLFENKAKYETIMAVLADALFNEVARR